MNRKGNGFQAELQADQRLALHFSRRALIDAGVLTPSTTELDLTGALTTGVRIAAQLAVGVH